MKDARVTGAVDAPEAEGRQDPLTEPGSGKW
jgi:hypothetical protein